MDKAKALMRVQAYLVSIENQWAEWAEKLGFQGYYTALEFRSKLNKSIEILHTVMFSLEKEKLLPAEKDADYPTVERSLSSNRSRGLRYVGPGSWERCAEDISKLVDRMEEIEEAAPKHNKVIEHLAVAQANLKSAAYELMKPERNQNE